LICIAGEHDADAFGCASAHTAEKLDAVYAWHSHVRDNYSVGAVGFERFERRRGIGATINDKSLSQMTLQASQYVGIVIDE
jgi:hypothetical protein